MLRRLSIRAGLDERVTVRIVPKQLAHRERRPLLFQPARIGEDYLWLPLIIADRPCHTDALAGSEVSGVPNFSRLWPAACSGLRGAAVTEEVQTPNAATAATGLNGLILSPTVLFGAGNLRQTRRRAGA